MSNKNMASKGVGSTGGSAFDRAQWLEAPECRRCFVPMDLNVGCEWPDDDRALLCGSCITRALEETLAQLDEVDEALTELGWHTDRGILQRVKQLTTSSPNVTGEPRRQLARAVQQHGS